MWVNMGDWLGPGYVPPRLREYCSFVEAREIVRSLGLENGKEWRLYCKGNLESINEKCPEDIPKKPQIIYKDKGWVDWYDWLGKPRPK